MKFIPGAPCLHETACFDPISTLVGGVGNLIGIGGAAASLGGAVIGSGAASSAADTQAASAAAAQQQQGAQYAQTRNDLMPYNTIGQQALGVLGANLGSYGTPDQGYIAANNQYVGQAQANLLQEGNYAGAAQQQFDAAATIGQGGYAAASRIGQGAAGQAALEQTPGYQFTLQQGLQATQNSAAARGLGVSGAALKGAASYATGLADQTYQQQYSDAMQNAQAQYGVAQTRATGTQSTGASFGNLAGQSLQVGQGYLASNSANQGNLTNSYNKLIGTAGLGESAASQTGTLGQQAATNQSGLITGAGNAQAAGTVGGANAISGGLTGAANSASNAYYANKLLGSGGSYADPNYNGGAWKTSQ